LPQVGSKHFKCLLLIPRKAELTWKCYLFGLLPSRSLLCQNSAGVLHYILTSGI
jgi:hypothetical protein